jgi:hypothetical protein
MFSQMRIPGRSDFVRGLLCITQTLHVWLLNALVAMSAFVSSCFPLAFAWLLFDLFALFTYVCFALDFRTVDSNEAK